MHVSPNVKPGDPIYRLRQFERVASAKLTTVERITPKQVIVDGIRFWKRNGREVSGWNRVWTPIEPLPEPEPNA